MPQKKPSLVALKKRNGRYLVRKRGGGVINAADKEAFLIKAGILKPKKSKDKPSTEG